MTYGALKNLTRVFLTGDIKLIDDDNLLLPSVKYALMTVATKADSLHLMTLSTTADVLRLAPGDYLIRIPNLPTTDTDEMDIDEELAPAVARFLASYFSREKAGIHIKAAEAIIADYNAKTWEIIEQMELEAEQEGVADLCYAAPNSEWTL